MKKFLVIFLMSFILITSSYALEFNAVPNPEVGTLTVSTDTSDLTAFEEMFKADTGYTVSQIVAIAEYNTSTDTELVQAYTTAMNSLSSKGYHYMYGSFQPYGQAIQHYRRFIKTSTEFDFGVYATYNSRSTRCLLNEGDLIYITGYSKNLSTVTSSGLFKFDYVSTFHNTKLKKITSDNVWTESNGYYFEPTLCNAVGDVSVPDTPSGNLIDSETFKSMISDLTQSDLFYQNVPSSHRKYFFVQYDTEKDRYIFYFYPSNYSIQGLLMNENDYYLISSEDFSWWENVVNFVQGLFKKENEEGFDYKMVYASVLEDGSFDYWFRNKSNEILDKTLFNFDNSPLVFSMVDIPFFGKHSGGGIDLDTGDKTLASSPESSLIGQTFEENPLELNPNPTTEVPASEQSFWSKILDRLSDIKSVFLFIPNNILVGIKSLFTIDFDGFFYTWDKFQQKASFLGETKDLVSNEVKKIELNPQEPPSITVDLTSANSKYDWGTEAICLDLSWYTAFKPKVDFFIICFCYGFFIWNLFKDLPNIINGIAGVGIAHNSSSIRDNYINDRAERMAKKNKR